MMKKTKFRIGSRGSKLALIQAGKTLDKLRLSFPEFSFEIEVIKTQGDLSSAGFTGLEQGVFTKEIDRALEQGRIDLAVHSAKDLPTALMPSLEIGAVLEREEVRDAWISAGGAALPDFKKGGVIATGSPRRKAQLLRFRPDLQVIGIRGNVPTRIRKMREGECEGMVLAACGLIRLGMENEITELLDKKIMMPAVSQGAIAVEIRKEDEDTAIFKKILNHEETFLCVEAERALLAALRGGCQVPVGAWSTTDGKNLHLEAVLFSPDGKESVCGEISGAKKDAARLGETLAGKLKSQGGAAILDGIRK